MALANEALLAFSDVLEYTPQNTSPSKQLPVDVDVLVDVVVTDC